MLTDTDQARRSKGIGSSEIAMLLTGDDGKPLSPWGGPHKLWRIKTGKEVKEDISNEPHIERGEFLEDGILKWYAKRTGNKIRKKPGTTRHKLYYYVVDSVDALAWRAGEEKPYACVEAKTADFFTASKYGEAGTDQIPKHYAVQGQWHMGAWGLTECDYPVFAGRDLTIYTSKHDEELWLCLLSIAEKFWVDHVLADKAPPIEPTDEASRWLGNYFKQREGAAIREATDDEARMIIEYTRAKLAYDKAEAAKIEIENQIKERIGAALGLHLPGNVKAKATWNTVKGRASIDWETMLADLASKHGLDIAALNGKYQKQGAPYRRFLVSGIMPQITPDQSTQNAQQTIAPLAPTQGLLI